MELQETVKFAELSLLLHKSSNKCIKVPGNIIFRVAIQQFYLDHNADLKEKDPEVEACLQGWSDLISVQLEVPITAAVKTSFNVCVSEFSDW